MDLINAFITNSIFLFLDLLHFFSYLKSFFYVRIGFRVAILLSLA